MASRKRKKFRIRAWGAPHLPPLDYETDEYPTSINSFGYPMVDICLQREVSLEAIKTALQDTGTQNG